MSTNRNSHFRSRKQRRLKHDVVPPAGSYSIDFDVFDEAVFEEAVWAGESPQPLNEELERLVDNLKAAQRELLDCTLATALDPLIPLLLTVNRPSEGPRPPFNAEYLLYCFLDKDERDSVIGDLIESYAQVVGRFNKRRADIWFYKQVIGSLWPLLRGAALRIGTLVWLGRILRRLIS